jgi:hypothetical protein
MRVERKNLGGGLYRLEPVATHWSERINMMPQSIMDAVMRDVINCMRQETDVKETFTPWGVRGSSHLNSCVHNNMAPKKRSYEELRRLESMREPDGIDIHVDRPLRENFFTRDEWAKAMAKYRTLEDVAKDCDWECREPMKGTDFYRSCPTPSNTWVDEDWDEDDFNWCDNDDDADWDDWYCPWGRY